MDTLNLLWKLEIYNIELCEYKSQLENIDENKKIKDANREFKAMETMYQDNKMRLKKLEDRIRMLEIELKNKDFLYTENKNQLYRGSITDLKQLEQLNKEGENLKDKIDDLEMEVLKDLEEIDLVKAHLKKIDQQMLDKNNYIKEEMGQNEFYRRKIKEKIDILEEKINNTSIKVDEKSLNLYKKIRSQKSNPIALIKEDICSGCNMRISSHQMQILGEDNKIVLCESCSRILYMKKN